jgi:hypothetical protein
MGRPDQSQGRELDEEGLGEILMDPSKRIVTGLPLDTLWDNESHLNAHCIRRVGKKEISVLLRAGSIIFVVADVGLPLRWIPEQDRFTFWKTEVKGRLVTPEADSFCLEAYPSGYCYIASEWHAVGLKPIIVLEMHH